MKRNAILSLVLILALAAGAFAWQQHSRVLAFEKETAALTAEVQQQKIKTKEQADLAAQLKSENETYLRESAALRKKLAALSENAPAVAANSEDTASPAPKKNGMADFFGKMMKDPKMKEMMRMQHGAALKQMYGDFIKSRGLTAQQSEQFYKLLLDKQMIGMEAGMSAMNGEEKGATDATAQTNEEQKAEADRQLQMLLGDSGYADYKDYEKTVGERMTLSRMQQQLAGNSTPLADEQAKTLLQVMIEERANTPASPMTSIDGNPRDKIRALAESGNADQFYQSEADLDQRILNRAGSILKPDQFSALESFQKQQLEMQKLGLEMAKKMMGNDQPVHQP